MTGGGPALIDAIATAFAAVPRPQADQYTTSPPGDEAYEESQAFWGKAWRAVVLTPPFLERYRDVLFWFTPAAFHYYLPAFLTAPVASGDPSPIYVVTILQLLRGIGKPSFCRERWQLLDEAQAAALGRWLYWLLAAAPSNGMLPDEVAEAIEVIRTRRWWT